MKTIEVNSSWLATLGVVVACFYAIVFLSRDIAHLVLQIPEPMHAITWLRWVELGVFIVAMWITAEFLMQPHSKALKFAVVFFLVGFGLKLVLGFGLLPSSLFSVAETSRLLTEVVGLVFLLVFLTAWIQKKVRVV